MMKEPKKKKDGDGKSKPVNNSGSKKIIASPYVIPPQILNILKEHSLGFILFSVDYHGNVMLNTHADNDILLDGLKNKLSKMLMMEEGMKDAMLEDMISNNLDREFGESPPETGDDDDEEAV